MYAALLNAAFLALAVAIFVSVRQLGARTPLVAKLFTPRQLLAQVEALDDADERGGDTDAGRIRGRALRVLNRDVAAHTLPPLPASLEWVATLFRVTDAQVVTYAGLDGVAFVRFFQARGQHPCPCVPPLARLPTSRADAVPSLLCPSPPPQACALLFGVAAVVVPLLLCPLYEAAGRSPSLPATSAAAVLASAPVGGHPLLMWAPVVVAYALFITLAALLRSAQGDLLHLRLVAADGGATDSPQSYAVLVTDIPTKHRSPEDVQAFFHRLFPEIQGRHGDVWPLVIPAPLTDAVEPAWEARNAAALRLAAVVAEYGDDVASVRSTGASSSLDVAVARGAHWNTKYDVHMAMGALHRAQKTLDAARASASGDVSSGAALVVFPTRVAAAAAGGPGHLLTAAGAASHGGRWHAQAAPAPDAVDWYAVQLSPRSRSFRRGLAMLTCTAVVLGFLFVVAAVSSLVSLQSLAATFPGALGPLAASKGAPVVDGYLAVLALLACLFAAPPALRFACRHSHGYIAVGDADAAAARAFLWLYLVDVFLGAAAIQALFRATQDLSGAATEENGVTLNDVAHALGGTMLDAAPFFMLIAMARAGTGMGMVLLRLADLPLVMWQLLTARTLRAERAAWAPNVPPVVSDWVPTSVFILFLGLVYAPLCPLMAIPCAIFFGAGAIIYRLQLLYVHAPGSRFSQDAALWVHLRDAVMDAVLVALAVLASVLAVHRAVGPAAAVALLFLVAAWTANSVRSDDAGAAFVHLPRDVAAAADLRTGALVAEALPWPLPESLLPRCMYDDTATQPDSVDWLSAEQRYRTAAFMGAPAERAQPPRRPAPAVVAPPPPAAPVAVQAQSGGGVIHRRVVIPGVGGYTPMAVHIPVPPSEVDREREPLGARYGATYGSAATRAHHDRDSASDT